MAYSFHYEKTYIIIIIIIIMPIHYRNLWSKVKYLTTWFSYPLH
jgi:hypothetical protein